MTAVSSKSVRERRAIRSILGSIAVMVVVGAATAGAAAVANNRGSAQSRYTSGIGRIRNVQTVTEIVTVRDASLRQDRDTDGDPRATSVSELRREYFVVTVQFKDAFYLVRASADTSWNLNPVTFRYDESIAVSVSADGMILDRGDGTDFRGRVIRVQYDERPFVPPLT
jgi:hypothetical protein